MKGFAVTNSTLAMQVYSPDWFLPNGLTVAVLECIQLSAVVAEHVGYGELLFMDLF